MEFKNLEFNEFMKAYSDLIVEVECGDSYDHENLQHKLWLDSRMKYLMAFGTTFCLYSDDDKPIGYLLLEFDKGLDGVKHSGRYGAIKQIGINPEFRSKKYGAKILKECEKSLKAQGGECLYVDMYEGNSDAIRFYVKNGFTPVACHPGMNGVNDKGQVYLYKVL